MRVICVIDGGALQAVYSDVPAEEVDVELLDYDNMRACDCESLDGKAEYEGYEELEKEIYSGALHSVW